MVLRNSKIFVKTLASSKNQKVQIQCGQFSKIKKKTCPQGCLLGGQLVQRIKVGLRLLKPDFKGFFKCCEQLVVALSTSNPTPASIRLRALGQKWRGRSS